MSMKLSCSLFPYLTSITARHITYWIKGKFFASLQKIISMFSSLLIKIAKYTCKCNWMKNIILQVVMTTNFYLRISVGAINFLWKNKPASTALFLVVWNKYYFGRDDTIAIIKKENVRTIGAVKQKQISLLS